MRGNGGEVMRVEINGWVITGDEQFAVASKGEIMQTFFPIEHSGRFSTALISAVDVAYATLKYVGISRLERDRGHN